MATKVGTKGQFVIEKRLRDELGIGPGWMAVQRTVDGQLRVDFVPPQHDRSAFGMLAKYGKNIPPPTGEEISEAAGIGMAGEYAEARGEELGKPQR